MIGDKKAQAFAYWVERAMGDLGIFPLDDPVVFGSAVMKLHGLKDEIGDVDLFVSQRGYDHLRSVRRVTGGDHIWSELRPVPDDPPFLEGRATIERRLSETKVMDFHAFHAWTGRDAWLDVPEAMATAERVCGVMCVRLELVAKWKQEALTWCVKHGVEIPGSPWEKHIADLNTLVEAGVKV